jgi:hypothetical protein
MAVDRHHSFRHGEASRLHAEPGRGERQQRLARLRGCRANLRAAAMNRRARGGRALVRADVGVELHPAELAHVEIELFAGDLQQARGVALAEFALAEAHRRGVVGVYGDPGIDRIGIGRAGDAAARGHGGHSRTTYAETDDERAAALEQIAAGEAKRGGVGHRVASAILVDAS